MNILILGASGMLGHRLWIDLSKNHQVWATVRRPLESLKHLPNVDLKKIITDFDVDKIDQFQSIFEKIRPQYVINCIGMIKQRSDSKNYIKSIQINSLFPHQIAEICHANGANFLHFSTDCVFSGSKGDYIESDFADANDLYGRSKFLGEVSYLDKCLTLRTSIIGRELFAKTSLLEWFLSQQDSTKGFDKAIFSGFPTHTISKILEGYLFKHLNLKGLYHLSSDPINKYDLLHRFQKVFNKDIQISRNSDLVIDRSLNSTALKKIIGEFPTHWNEIENDLLIDNEIYN